MLTTFSPPESQPATVPTVAAPDGCAVQGAFRSLRPSRLFALAQQISNPQGFWVNACIGEPLPYRSFRGLA